MEINNSLQKEKVSRFFDVSESWKGTMYSDSENHFNRAMIRRKNSTFQLLKKARALTPGSSLDIGCGCGIYSEELQSLGFSTYGIDLSEEMIDVCRSKFDVSKSHFLTADIENIPFGNEFFDLIICVGVFGYLLDDNAAMKEVVRVLKPGGYFFISVQNIMSMSNFDYVVRKKFFSNGNSTNGLNRSASIPVPWVSSNTSTNLFYKSYYPRKLEMMISSYGFALLNSISLGYEFRFARRLHLLPKEVLNRLEEAAERAAQKVPIALLKYSGDTFSAVFRKNII